MKKYPCMIKKSKYIILIAAITWFLSMELFPTIKMPELTFDEAGYGISSLMFIKNLPMDGFYFLGKHFPTHNSSYHGAMDIYLLSPFLLFGGASVEALRMGPILFGVIILILTYYFGCKFFNLFVGLVSTLLLSTNIMFIELIKRGAKPGFSMPFFTLSSLLFFLKWHQTKKDLYFGLGMFVLGLGLNVKGHYMWLMVALFISFCALYIPFNRIKIKTIFIGTICMILGALPVLSFYLKKEFLKNRVLAHFFISEKGINNLHIFENLSTRIEHVNLLFRGSNKTGNNFSIFFFWFCVITLLYLLYSKRKMILPKKRIAFMLSLFFITIISSIFTLTKLSAPHLIIVFPYMQIIMTITIFEMIKYLNITKPFLIKSIVFFLVVALVFSNIVKCTEEYNGLKKQEKSKRFCSIQLLNAWFLENGIYNVIASQGSTTNQLEFLSDLKIKIHLYSTLDDFKNTIKNAKPNDFFLFSTKITFHDALISKIEMDSFKLGFSRRYQEFELLAREFNKKIIIHKEFLWSNGNPRYIICSLESLK